MIGDYRVESIMARLDTTIVGKSIHMHRQVGSTNDLVKDAGRLGAECDGPFDLIRIANIDVGIDDDDLLGTLAAGDRAQDRVSCLPCVTLLH